MSVKFFSTAIFAALLAVSISGCATASPPPAPVESTPVGPIPVEPDPASETCDAVGMALTISFNAKEGLRRGLVGHDAYVMRLKETRTMLKAIKAEPGTNIATALSNVVSYIDNATPTADGAPYDPSSIELVDLNGILGYECTAAGFDVIIKAQYGG